MLRTDWKYVPFKELFDWCQKSDIKSGSGKISGKYKMFICSDATNKMYDEYIETGESLVFGTGGKASLHFVNKDEKFAYSTDCAVAKKKETQRLCTKFYYYFLRQKELAVLQSTFTGSGLQHTSKTKIGALVVPCLSYNEQQKIVEKIENQLSQLERGIENLKKIKQQVKCYRQTVIQSGFTGVLTDNWRKNNAIQGVWNTINITQVAEDSKNAIKVGPFGSSLKKECYVSNGYKIYGQEQVICGDENYGNYYVNEKKYQELISYKIKPNDILISLVGTVGKVLILSDRCPAGLINPRLIKISLDQQKMLPKFFKYYFESDYLKSLYKLKAHGATMDVLNLRIIKELPLPLCSIDEQEQVVTEIESRLSVCENIENIVDKTIMHTETLEQSILKKAFEGDL